MDDWAKKSSKKLISYFPLAILKTLIWSQKLKITAVSDTPSVLCGLEEREKGAL